MLCLGDLVGYGAEPFECIQAVKDKPNVYCIAGNHDRQVIGDKDPRMRKTATKVLEWTADNISPSNARYLKQLPQGITVDDTFIMVHGSLVERDAYILTPQEISKNLQCMINDFAGMKICFFGHTHVPMLIGTKAVITDLRETKSFQLDRNDIYLINPGSVGQPRDRDTRACYVIWDRDNELIEFRRVEYDYRKTMERIFATNAIPKRFGERLEVGR